MALIVGGTAVDATAAELNIMGGVTSTAAELNELDGFVGDLTGLFQIGKTSSSPISECNFRQVDVETYQGVEDDAHQNVHGFEGSSCFLPDQKITMADNTLKEIRDVIVGDKILAWDENNDETVFSEVKILQKKKHKDVYVLKLENGKELKPTGNHPFWTKTKGWTTIDGHSPNHGGGSEKLEIGDEVFVLLERGKEPVKVVDIALYGDGDEEYMTYNFEGTENHTIIADGIITHNSGSDGAVLVFIQSSQHEAAAMMWYASSDRGNYHFVTRLGGSGLNGNWSGDTMRVQNQGGGTATIQAAIYQMMNI